MSIPEVNRTIEAWGWREKRKRLQQEQLVYTLPCLISALFDKKGYPKIYDVFPGDFEEQRNQDAMNNMLQWAQHFNKQFDEGAQNG